MHHTTLTLLESQLDVALVWPVAVEKGQEGTLHGRDEPVDEDLPFKLLFILDPTDVDDFNGIGL